MKIKKILFISIILPFKADSGGIIISSRVLDELMSREWNINFMVNVLLYYAKYGLGEKYHNEL